MKKGFVMTNKLVSIILLIVGFTLVTSLITQCTTAVTEDNADIENACKASVDLRVGSSVSASYAGQGVEDVKGFPLLCQTIDTRISGNQEEVKAEFARLSERCWWMFRMGKTENLFKNLPGTDEKNRGFVCYTVYVEEIEDGSITGAEFMEYMRTTKTTHANDDIQTHLDYIQYGGGPGRVLTVFGKADGVDADVASLGTTELLHDKGTDGGVIEAGRAYEIAFIEKGAEANTWISTTLLSGGSLAAVGGTIAVATGGIAGVVIGVGVAGAGVYAAISGGETKVENYFAQKDVSTLLIMDVSHSTLRKKLHADVFVSEEGGN